MNIYPEGYQVEVQVAYTDLNGNVVVPTEILVSLRDGNDFLVEDFGAVSFTPGAGSVTIVVPGAFGMLADYEQQAARILRTEIVTAAGVIRRSTSWIVEGLFRLAIMVNSFQSMEAAQLLANDMPNLTGWTMAPEEKQFAALIEAYNRLTRIQMKYRTNLVLETERHVSDLNACETVISRDGWSLITEDDFLAMPDFFRKALRRAQLLEANEMLELEGSAIGKKMRAGLLSERIGESAVTFNGSKLSLGISSRSLEALAGLVYYSVRIARS